MNFKEEQEDRVSYIEKVLGRYLPKEEGFQKTVFEAMNYSIMAGGKRIRPMLMLETYGLFEGRDKKVIEPFMVAIEMIHTYSLVHDDLPALDNDDYRRGKKTTHAVYGEAMAILAGDGLLNYAYEIAAKAFEFTDDYRKVADGLRILLNKAGIYGMIGGQVADIESTSHMINKEKLDFIYRLKTAALIEASMLIGATLSGATPSEIKTVGEIARDVGMAFQIQDDILDVTSTIEVLGKQTLSDEKNHKTTYVTLVGIEQGKQDVEYISQRALKNLTSLNKNNEYLNTLIETLITREK